MQHRSTTEVLTTFSSKLILFLITTRERSYPLFLPPKLHHRTILPSVIPYRGKDSPVNLCITANRRICKFLRNVWFHFIPPFPKVEIPRVDERDPLSQMEEERRIRFVVYIYIFIIETGCCRKREERDLKCWKGKEKKNEFTFVFRVSSSVDRHDLSLITLSP